MSGITSIRDKLSYKDNFYFYFFRMQNADIARFLNALPKAQR